MKGRALKELGKIVLFTLKSKLAIVLALEILVSVLLGIFSLYVFSDLAEGIFRKEVFTYDTAITNYIYQFRSPSLTSFMMIVTSCGRGLVLFSLSVITILYLYTKRKKDALIFSAILYTGVIVNLVLKELVHRPRPQFSPLVYEHMYSFPSGHAMNSFVFYAAIAYFVWRQTKNITFSLFLSSVCVGMIIIIGISRVYLGAHYPSDVLGGYIGGFFWFISAILFEKTIIFERLYRANNAKK